MMNTKARFCPFCGGALSEENTKSFTFCPHCGEKIQITYEETPPTAPKTRNFTLPNTGFVLASAIIPSDYQMGGMLKDEWQSEQVPFTVLVQAVSPDQEIFLVSSSNEVFTDYRNSMLKKVAACLPGAVPSGFRDFVEPEIYLQEYAQSIAGVPVTPVAKSALPSRFGRNLAQERARFQAEVNASLHADPGQPLGLSNLTCEAILMKFTAHINGREMVVFVGSDYQGSEVYMLNGIMGNMGGVGSILGGMQNAFGGTSSEEPKNAFDYFMKGGLFGQKMREKKAANQQRETQTSRQTQGAIPFGHAKEYGKRSDVIYWGSRSLYGMVAPVEREQEATELFIEFVGSLKLNPELEQRAQQMAKQKEQQFLMQSQQYQMQTRQLQMQNMYRQQQLSQQIARNNAEISAGMMDSFERRGAAMDRMSTGYSEAIRGVNTYTTPTGRTVEASVGADHVYQNQFGDTFGVSGNGLDSETAAKLNWTELNKK